jgi:hypothetical protein
MLMPFLSPLAAARCGWVQPPGFGSTRHCTPEERLVNKDAKTFWHTAGTAKSGNEKLRKWAKLKGEGKNGLDKEIDEEYCPRISSRIVSAR